MPKNCNDDYLIGAAVKRRLRDKIAYHKQHIQPAFVNKALTKLKEINPSCLDVVVWVNRVIPHYGISWLVMTLVLVIRSMKLIVMKKYRVKIPNNEQCVDGLVDGIDSKRCSSRGSGCYLSHKALAFAK